MSTKILNGYKIEKTNIKTLNELMKEIRREISKKAEELYAEKLIYETIGLIDSNTLFKEENIEKREEKKKKIRYIYGRGRNNKTTQSSQSNKIKEF